MIAEQPFLFTAVNEIREGYRRSICGRDSVYYQVVESEVEIMAILGAQDLSKWV